MIDLILDDFSVRPDIFFWWGPLPISAIEDWEQQNSLHVPQDLKLLWSTKGGGDLFDTESILQPFGTEDYDLIGPVTLSYRERGLEDGFCVFQTGLVNSVFRKSDGSIFSLKSPSELLLATRFDDLDDWYKSTLRETYAKGYGLQGSDHQV